MELTEAQVFEALGLEGGREQEPADPASVQAEGKGTGLPGEGEREQGPADPAEDREDEQEDPTREEGEREQDPADPAEDEGHEPREMGLEQRREAAAARRRKETQDAIDRAVKEALDREREAMKAQADQDAQRMVEEWLRTSGLTDPYTKRPITTRAEYDAYRVRFEAEQREKLMKRSGMSDEEFGRFVESLPEVRQAKEEKDRAEQEKRKAREQRMAAQVQAELEEIHKMDPTISTVEDLMKMPTSKAFYGYVQKGNSFLDAYRLANFDALTKAREEAARHQALVNARGKDHLGTDSGRGGGAAPVPADIKAEYLTFNPTATDAEIQAHYNKYLKR